MDLCMCAIAKNKYYRIRLCEVAKSYRNDEHFATTEFINERLMHVSDVDSLKICNCTRYFNTYICFYAIHGWVDAKYTCLCNQNHAVVRCHAWSNNNNREKSYMQESSAQLFVWHVILTVKCIDISRWSLCTV